MKKRTPVVVRPATQEGPTIRIIKRASCPSVSGKSTLVYEVGLPEGTRDVQLRVVSNSGSGCFSQNWVTLKDIQTHLDKVPKGQTVTSHVLAPLVRGVSQNTPGFLWAALVHAGFAVASKEKKRAYERTDPVAFMEEIKALADGKKPADAKAKRAKAPPEVHTESPSASTKKKKAKG